MVRIAIAISVLLTLRQLATLSTVRIPGPPELYRPVGIWMLFGRLVPPDFVITLLWVIAIGSTVLMLVGLFSRGAAVVSFITAVALTSASFASSTTWSHQYNVVFLAQIAFLGARGGDVLSLDALIRRLRGRPPIDVARGYQWSVRLVLLAVALMFAGAAFHKLLHGQFTLRWALSDNLRHQLLVRFDLADLPRPTIAAWLMEDVWRYRTAAVLNLISQTMPIFASIFVRRPLLRAFAGGFFVVETLALGLVVNLWNWHWLPLAAVFVDWDRLFGWVARRVRRTVPIVPAAASPLSADTTWSPPRAPRRFIIGFIIYEFLTSFIPTLDQVLNTYPFSGFPMFAGVRARKPYDQHMPYTVPGDHFEAISERPLNDRAQRWIDHMNRRLYTVTDPVVFKKRLATILADVQRRFPEFGIRGLRHYLAVYEAPAYPEPARFIEHKIAVMGELDANGTFRTVLGKLDKQAVTLVPQNVDTAGAKLVRYTDAELSPRDVPGERTGDRFATGPVDGDPLYVVAVIGDTAWLVGTRKQWRWE